MRQVAVPDLAGNRRCPQMEPQDGAYGAPWRPLPDLRHIPLTLRLILLQRLHFCLLLLLDLNLGQILLLVGLHALVLRNRRIDYGTHLAIHPLLS